MEDKKEIIVSTDLGIVEGEKDAAYIPRMSCAYVPSTLDFLCYSNMYVLEYYWRLSVFC